jgi:hypothetical protein
MNKSAYLVVTSAIAIDGTIAKPGTLVEVTDAEARNLLARGKARVATEKDGAPAPDDTAGTAEGEGTEAAAADDQAKAADAPAKTTRAKANQ